MVTFDNSQVILERTFKNKGSGYNWKVAVLSISTPSPF